MEICLPNLFRMLEFGVVAFFVEFAGERLSVHIQQHIQHLCLREISATYCADLLDFLKLQGSVCDFCDAPEVGVLHDLFVERHHELFEESLKLSFGVLLACLSEGRNFQQQIQKTFKNQIRARE